MSGYPIGARIGIDGEKQFRDAMKSINLEMKKFGSEMSAVASQFDKNETSIESYRAKNQVLEKSIDSQKNSISILSEHLKTQKTILEQLEQEVQNAATAYGESSKEVIRAESAYRSQSNAIANLETQLNRSAAALNVEERELDKNRKAIRDIERGYNDAGDKVDEFGNTIEKAGDKSNRFADILKANLLSDAIMAGFRKLADLAKELASTMIDSAATVNAETAQFEQTFKESGAEATAAIKRVAENSGIMETRLQQTASSIFSFARASGAKVPQAMKLMEDSLQTAADSAAYYDKSLEDTSQTLLSFLKGNFANDAALGVSATETTRNAKAMELFGRKYKNLSEIQKQQTLLKMVTDAQKLSGAMGQASREADGYENVMGNLKETWRQFTATVGAPFLESIIPIIQDITAEFQKWLSSFDKEQFSKTIKGIFDFIKNNKGVIIAALSAIAASVAGLNIAAKFGDAAKGIELFKKGLDGLKLAMNANPYAVLIAAIAAVVVAIVRLWKTNEDFRNAVIGAWDAIKKAASSLWKTISDFFGVKIPAVFRTIVDFFKTNWQSLLLLLVAPFAGAVKLLYDLNPKFKAWVDNLISSVIQKIKAWGAKIKEWGTDIIKWATTDLPKAVSDIVSKILSFFTELPDKLLEIGKDMIRGLWDGIKSMATWLKDKVMGFMDGIVNGVKGVLGIHSPSRVFAGIGQNMAAGLNLGFADEIKKVQRNINSSIPAPAYPVSGSPGGSTTYGAYNDQRSYHLSVPDERMWRKITALVERDQNQRRITRMGGRR